MKTSNSLAFAAALSALLFTSSVAAAATITVDPRDPKAYATLSEAVDRLKPGDTLVLAPGSGPFREPLHIRVSGTAAAPITIEGNGNEVTGFDPLVFTALPDGRMAAPVVVEHPFVLRHNGSRVAEDAATAAFVGGITYNATAKQLVLNPDVSPEGWEISVRDFAVRVSGVSHHVYRNLAGTGSRNDGFNLHGDGTGLRFESITGSQNLDEGFSAHATSESEIRGGRFFENDNGMLNGFQTVTRLENVDVFDNLGLGLAFNGEAKVDGVGVRTWGNGLTQLLLRKGVQARFTGIEIYRNPHQTRPWVTYMESARWPRPVTMSVDRGVTSDGIPLTQMLEAAPADAPTR
ncbi:MAG: right-handed parallel beta-helix repeat-containing protein [Verrucomicrobiota bacterium]